jgi:hypothetical protein
MTWTTEQRTSTTMAMTAEALAGIGGVPARVPAEWWLLHLSDTPRTWSSRHPNASGWQHITGSDRDLLPRRLPGIQPRREALCGSATTPTRTWSGHHHGTTRIGSELERSCSGWVPATASRRCSPPCAARLRVGGFRAADGRYLGHRHPNPTTSPAREAHCSCRCRSPPTVTPTDVAHPRKQR